MAEAKTKKTTTKAAKDVAKVVDDTKKLTEEVTEDKTSPKATKAVAKAGKRSKKAVEEVDAKVAKTERKKVAKVEAEEQKQALKHVPTPKKLENMHSKGWRTAAEQIDREKLYDLPEAIALLQKISKVKFDPSVELHINLGIDPRQSDQIVRTSAVLPAGTGKSVRVAVVADEKGSAEAKKAGADVVDSEKIIADIIKGKFDFDVLVTTPDQMPTLAKHAKVLGPKGLMPSPKAGTVSTDLAKTIAEIKAGKAELKTDTAGIVHIAVGKLSFKADDLVANIQVALQAVVRARPAAAKGTFLKSANIAASMSPSIKLDTTSALKN